MALLIKATYPEPAMVFIAPGDSLPEDPQIGEEVQPANGRDFKLAEAQALVGGMIEIHPLDDGRIIVINEEGKLEQLPINVEATILWRQTYGGRDVIVGDVLVCKTSELR
ncbi:MAG: hypothetical protein QOJ10_1457 [Chloroflexota bacterium]|jgi:hypothetical protein|nr:hypothetical protein [Chloroflexota bacterium]